MKTTEMLSCNKVEFPFISRVEDKLTPYPVRIGPRLVTRLENCLNDLHIAPVSLNSPAKTPNGEDVQPMSLLVSLGHSFNNSAGGQSILFLLLNKIPPDGTINQTSPMYETGSVVQWSPPQPNW